jgi:tetratricopeptide (TPR) repeat protein
VITRFEAERQALALMDHASIARVFDGGTTPEGRPYFVMEFVDGVKITDYCDAHCLSVHDRLRLFIQVCQAVQHAHQKGIIHRDLKPSNILVTEQDGQPLPKVIDFGIAKATFGQRLANESVHTAILQFAGTPAYMSPEQASSGRLDVDSRSDVYSLGMLLYELLVAQPAFTEAELVSAALDEMLRIIREQDPPRPSARLTTFPQASLTSVSRQRQTQPITLRNHLRGDLDWIVMMALEKDRNRRYETASGLAMDIGRYLANEPVRARPPVWHYRLLRLIRRNRVVFAAITAIAVGLLVGLGAATWSYLREKDARQRAVAAEDSARTEATRSRQVAAFLTEMLGSVGPSVAQGQDTKLLRGILDRTVQRVDRDLQTQPEVAADLCMMIGSVYRQLGDYPQAEIMVQRGLDLRRQVFGDRHRKVADALSDLANVLVQGSKLEEAAAAQSESLEMRRKLLGPEHADVATSLDNLGVIRWQQGQFKEAETSFRQGLELRRKLYGNRHEDVALSLDNLGMILSCQNDLKEAEAIQREAIEMNRQLLGENHPDLALSMNNLADTLHASGKLTEAASLNREVLAKRIKIFGDEHPDVAFSLNNLATVLADQGQLAEAESTHRSALAMRRKLLSPKHLDVAASLNNLTSVLIRENKLDEAEACQLEALTIQRQSLAGEHPDIAGSIDNLALINRRRLAPAQPSLAQALGDLAAALQTEAVRKKITGGQPDVAASLAELAEVLLTSGKLTEAEGYLREEVGLHRERIKRNLPPHLTTVGQLLNAYSRLLRTLLANGKNAEAELLAREYLAQATAELSDAWQAADASSLLGACLSGLGRFAEAEPLLLAGHEGLLQRQQTIPLSFRSTRVKEAIQRLIRHYQASERPAQAAEWTAKLKNFD